MRATEGTFFDRRQLSKFLSSGKHAPKCSSAPADGGKPDAGAPGLIGDVIGPFGPIDELAMTLVDELAHCGEAMDWADLNEGEREFYRGRIEKLLLNWSAVMRAHLKMTGDV
jgi:hypothetical protein